MSFFDTLVAGGAVALGYWVVRSVLQPGFDLTETDIKVVSQKPGVRPAPARGKDKRSTSLPHAFGAAESRQGAYAWYVVLDVPSSAGRMEIQEALKRRIAKARSDGDRAALADLLRAASAGIREPQRGKAAIPRPRPR